MSYESYFDSPIYFLHFLNQRKIAIELYIIKDYQRLKADENSRLSLGWNLNRTLAKINYRIHTDAINPKAKGNIRDESSLQQLIVLANMESLNAEFIRQGLTQKERLLRLNASAKRMMKSLLDSVGVERLKRLEPPKEQ